MAKKVRLKEGLELRTHLKIMMCIHVTLLVLELFFYNLLLTMVFGEILYLWLCYYCYMTMNKCSLVTYICLLVISLTQFMRVFDVGLGMSMLLYVAQLGLVAYFGVYLTSLKTKAYFF